MERKRAATPLPDPRKEEDKGVDAAGNEEGKRTELTRAALDSQEKAVPLSCPGTGVRHAGEEMMGWRGSC